MKIGFAQINPTVGDLRGNCELITRAYERLAAAGAELVLTPELAMTGYPPQDLVLKSHFVPENLELLAKLHARIGDAALLVGFVDRNEGRGKPFRNAAALLERGKPIIQDCPLSLFRTALALSFQVRSNFGELGEGGLEVFDDLSGDDVGIVKVGAVFEAFVFEPEDFEIKFVSK